MKFVILAITVTALCVSVGHTQMADREGYTSSVSLGLAPVTKFSFADTSETGMALVFGFSVGYGLDDRNVIVVQGNLSARNSDYFTALGRTYTHLDGSALGDQKVTQAFIGLGWYHYFSKKTKTWYSNLTAGAQSFRVRDFNRSDPGFAWKVELGYQFCDRIQAGSFTQFGRTDHGDTSYDHVQMGLVVTLLKY